MPLGGLPCVIEVPGAILGPAPRADRRPVELERRDDEEDARVGRRRAAAEQEDREQRGAEQPADVLPRQHRDARDAPRQHRDEGDADEQPLPARREPGERDAAEVDEPVRGWHERRQVLEPVGVEAPDDRAARSRRTVATATTISVCARRSGETAPERDDEGEHGDEAEQELAAEADVAVGPSSAAR